MNTGSNSDNDDPDSSDSPSAFGFYSVLDLESAGYCGGFLVLGENGRPIEFHCTLPIIPERAQQILYGHSLVPFLYSEHIGPSLLQKAKTKTRVVFVDNQHSLPLTQFVAPPVACLLQSENESIQFKAANAGDQKVVENVINEYKSFDWMEPFDRIRTALEEAHAVAR